MQQCPKCGAAFLETRASRTYCSPDCRIAAGIIRTHERLRVKFDKDATCANRFCARPFKKLRRDHRFCRAKCYQAPPTDSRTRNATSSGTGLDVGDAVLAFSDQRQSRVLEKLSETGPKRLQYRMLEVAILDVRQADGLLREDAVAYLRGERDDRLPASIRAQDCFDTFGLDARAVRQSLGI